MNQTFDVVIAGLGAMGSSVAMHLARRGVRVLGIDRYRPPHDRGSSSGRTRLIREAYYEHPLYVPLVRRSYELWHALSGEIGSPLVHQAGSLMIGDPRTGLVQGTLRSAHEHAVAHEVLEASELVRRFPVFRPLDEMIGVYEPGSSLLLPEAIIAAHLELAARRGAVLRFGEPITGWEARGDGVEVAVGDDRVTATHLVVASGAWIGDLLGDVVPVVVERQVQQWWEPARHPELHRVGTMPVTMWELADGRIAYTMPDMGDGVKVGWHHPGPPVHPETVDRTIGAEEQAALNDLLRRFVPHAKGERLASAICFYTKTADGHFVVDELPGAPVTVVSACSGHGFKFSSVIGEIVADRLTTGSSAFDLSPFRLERLRP